MEELFKKLEIHGGSIVSSNDCTRLEIAEAKACNNMWVNESGLGFIWFPKQNA